MESPNSKAYCEAGSVTCGESKLGLVMGLWDLVTVLVLKSAYGRHVGLRKSPIQERFMEFLERRLALSFCSCF